MKTIEALHLETVEQRAADADTRKKTYRGLKEFSQHSLVQTVAKLRRSSTSPVRIRWPGRNDPFAYSTN